MRALKPEVTHSILPDLNVHLECHPVLDKLCHSVEPKKSVRNRAPRKLDESGLFEYSVKYLGLRASSSEELRSRLRRRAAQPGDVERVIERLLDIGYLNDQRFAESFASNRVENNGFGRMRVLSDLRSRRVPAKLADQAVAQAFEGRAESDLIDEFIERRMPQLAGGQIEDEKKIAAAYRRLRRAGFASNNIFSALKRIATRPEFLDEAALDEEENAPEA